MKPQQFLLKFKFHIVARLIIMKPPSDMRPKLETHSLALSCRQDGATEVWPSALFLSPASPSASSPLCLPQANPPRCQPSPDALACQSLRLAELCLPLLPVLKVQLTQATTPLRSPTSMLWFGICGYERGMQGWWLCGGWSCLAHTVPLCPVCAGYSTSPGDRHRQPLHQTANVKGLQL